MSQYSDYGFKNDHIIHTHRYLIPALEQLLDKKTNKLILDVGCGNGAIAKYFIDQGFDVYGIDASESGIAIARESYTDRFFLQDITSKRLPKEIQDIPFDTIISTEVIEHLYSPREYIAFCKDILLVHQDHGTLILSTPYHGYLKNLVLALTGKLDGHFTALWDGGHIKFWSRRTLTILLEEQGFQVSSFTGIGRVPWLWKSMMLEAKIRK